MTNSTIYNTNKVIASAMELRLCTVCLLGSALAFSGVDEVRTLNEVEANDFTDNLIVNHRVRLRRLEEKSGRGHQALHPGFGIS